MLRSILSLQVKIEWAKGEPFIIVKYYSGIIKIAKDRGFLSQYLGEN